MKLLAGAEVTYHHLMRAFTFRAWVVRQFGDDDELTLIRDRTGLPPFVIHTRRLEQRHHLRLTHAAAETIHDH
jgi:hypothetical protein